MFSEVCQNRNQSQNQKPALEVLVPFLLKRGEAEVGIRNSPPGLILRQYVDTAVSGEWLSGIHNWNTMYVP